jgi:pyruvate,water dikinase
MAGWWRRWIEKRLGEDAVTLRRRYERFQHLIKGNNRVLELIADAGEKSGGDYLFDMRYLNGLVNELEKGVEGVVYDLNAMSDGRYIDLVEVFEYIRQRVRSTLSPSELTESGLAIPLDQVDYDIAGAVGEKMASIGELRNKLGIFVPDGFVISASACHRHFQSRGLAQSIASQSDALKEGDTKVEEVSERLQQAVKRTPLPGEVARAIRTEIKRPDRSDWMYAVRSSALGEDGEHSFAGQYETLLNVRPSDAVEAYREVLASLFSDRSIRYRAAKGIPINDALMAVGFLAMVPARASGVLHTVDPSAPQTDRMVVSAAHGLGPTVVGGFGRVDQFELTRDPTPRILSRKVERKESSILAREGGGIKALPVPPSKQELACISDDELIELGRMALRIERHAGHHQEIEWAVDQEGRIAILQSRTLRIASSFRARQDDNLAQILAEKPVLLRGKGIIACRGIGAGPIVAVRSPEDFRAFPHGGILVVQSTSPQYSPLLARANAVITKVGSSTGHLAAVAREFRVPMLVDVRESAEVLKPGTDVTVDAEENVIYEGIIHELLHYHLSNERTDAEFEEFRLLRRLLRRITPLNLTDPESEGFRARSCATYHDVIRFAHEMAVRELVNLPGMRTRDRKRFVRRLQLSIPMDLDVLDLGGGLAKSGDERTIARDQLRSEPLVCLLRGLCAPGTWRTEPVDMDMESLLSSATRATSVAVADAAPARFNIAVVSENYLNLHLLLGYHFNMVDCHLSDLPSANYIYFRFTGGVTDITRRSRRARVIAAILEEFEFGVDVKGDLVIGRFRNADQEPMRERLEMLGRLIGFTRQLDVVMRDVETMHEHIREFIGHEPLSIDGLTFRGNAESL